MIAVRPHAHYVCFEPSKRFRDVLERNVRENEWQCVVVEDVLVAASVGTVRLYTNTSTASAATRDYGGHAFLGASEVAATTLDNYFEKYERLDFLKSDTDGFDGDVLIGAQSVLGRFAPALYFEFAPFLLRRAGRVPGDVLDLLQSLGYRRFVVFAQDGSFLHFGEDVSEIIRIAEEHGYVDPRQRGSAEPGRCALGDRLG
jgi:FkbM family methyltransferase